MVNSKPKLVATQTIFSLFLLTFLLSITNVNSESVSVSFPKFDNVTDTIVLGGDAKNIGGVLQLTEKNQLGNPSTHSFGLSVFSKLIRLYEETSVDLAAVLSDWVLIGFSGATGELAETHDILSWSFTTNL
ncbi:hypothetical protein RYX36_004352 [Vicia faba]